MIYEATKLHAILEELKRRGYIDIKVTLNPLVHYSVLKENALRDLEDFLRLYVEGKGVETEVGDRR